MHAGFALQDLHLQEHFAPAAFGHIQQLHGCCQGCVVYTVVEHTSKAGHHAPLVPCGKEALPGGPQLWCQLVVATSGFRFCAFGGSGTTQLLQVQAELAALLLQLGRVLLRLRAVRVQEVVADGASEFFAMTSGS